MKVIFLDIEGVLNTKETYERVYRTRGYTTMIDSEIDNFRLDYLKIIIERTDAKIVLSSSFRYFFDRKDDKLYPTTLKGEKLYDKFKRHGIEIYDITPINMNSREKQIEEWLSNRNDIESFVIIDDDSTAFVELYDNLIHTSNIRQNYLSSFLSESTGLCERHIDEVTDKLNGKTREFKKSF